jgi:hypothetical protein
MQFFKDQSSDSLKVFFLLALIVVSGVFIVSSGGSNGGLLGRVFNKKDVIPAPIGGSVKTGLNISLSGSNPTTADCTAANAGMPGSVRYCNAIFSQLDVVIMPGIVFSPTYDLKFDVYSPPASDTLTNRAAVINFHGGGSDETSVGPCKQYASLGYVCFSGDYRNDNPPQGFTSAEQKHAASDAQAMVRYLRLHASEYGIDPNKIMLSGISAGGTVSLEAAISANNLDNVNWFSANDLEVNRDNQFGVVSSETCYATSNSGAPMESTNILIGPGDPRTALFLGEDDKSHGWTCTTGQVFNDLLTGIGIQSHFQCFEDTGHSLGHADEIDAVVIPAAYEEMIVKECSQ